MHNLKMQDLKVTDQLARRENARHEMQALTFSVLLKMQNRKLLEFSGQP